MSKQQRNQSKDRVHVYAIKKAKQKQGICLSNKEINAETRHMTKQQGNQSKDRVHVWATNKHSKDRTYV